MKTERIEVRVEPHRRESYDRARGDVPISIWIRKTLDEAAARALRRAKGDKHGTNR